MSADVDRLSTLNYRNHRKIVVIDGEIGYTGGMNMGQEYIDGGERFASWRDTHLRMTGQAVAALQKLFAARWFEDEQRGPLHRSRTCPRRPGRRRERARPAQVVAHAVEDPWKPARRAHMIAIGQRRASGCGSSRRTSCPTRASTTR